jgi:phosphohistidine phosphatase
VKVLLLLRHAKSSWDDPALEDFDRPLAARGRKAAPLMGRAMAERGWIPARALVSPALRTRQTWRLVLGELGDAAPQVVHEDALYMASAGRILALVRQSPPELPSLLVLGHNPGLEDLARGLAGPGSDPESFSRMREKFPTAALARFEIEDRWAGLGVGGARLTHFLRPKDIGP